MNERNIELAIVPNPLSVIIPFKNESQNIQHLINALNKVNLSKNIEFIFINDFSTDNSGRVLLEQLDIPFKLINLKENLGKKNAIENGINLAIHEQILTLDADVIFPKEFFDKIQKLQFKSLSILPVRLKAKTLFQKLNRIEFQWLQTITFGTASMNQPILCNGANLLFTKEAYFKAKNIRTDFDIKSGDDYFFLTALRELKVNIDSFPQTDLSVYTNASKNLPSLLNQRSRWLKKAINFKSITAIFLIAIFNLLFFYSISQLGADIYYILPIILKLIIEWFGIKGDKNIFAFIIHQLYYPIYGLILLCYLPFKNKW